MTVSWYHASILIEFADSALNVACRVEEAVHNIHAPSQCLPPDAQSNAGGQSEPALYDPLYVFALPYCGSSMDSQVFAKVAERDLSWREQYSGAPLTRQHPPLDKSTFWERSVPFHHGVSPGGLCR